MIGVVGLREQREAVRMLIPREVAAVDDQAADRRAVAADVLGRRIDDDRRTVLERPRDKGSGGVVGDQRHTKRAADVGNLLDREDVELRVGEDFGVVGAGLIIGCAAEGFGIARIDEARLDSELPERLREQGPGAAVEVGGGDDIVAGLREVQHRIGRGRLAGGDGERGRPAFEGGRSTRSIKAQMRSPGIPAVFVMPAPSFKRP
jgi:hypothetical protein